MTSPLFATRSAVELQRTADRVANSGLVIHHQDLHKRDRRCRT